MTDERYQNLEQLGSATAMPASPDAAILERVSAETGGKRVVVRSRQIPGAV